MTSSQLAPGRICLTAVGLFTMVGPFVVDWDDSHVFNNRWPPHAKFHHGQTMTTALLLGLSTIWAAWRPNATAETTRFAAVFGCLYYVAALSGWLYPGSKAVDPEFIKRHPDEFPQLPVFVVPILVTLLGAWLETRRLSISTARKAV